MPHERMESGFSERVDHLFKTFREDIRSVIERDPAARNGFEVFFLYSGVHAVMWHRIAHWFYCRHMKFIARLISQFSRFLTGVEIHPAAKIGKGLFIDHGMGVVIGETAEVGDNCTIYQGVTLGGPGKECGKRHPTIGDNVMIGSGAKVLGPFCVGSNSKIAAGAVVLSEVPSDSTAVGVPARIVSMGGERVYDLDQVKIPDPVAQQITALSLKVDEIKAELERLKNENNTGGTAGTSEGEQ